MIKFIILLIVLYFFRYQIFAWVTVKRMVLRHYLTHAKIELMKALYDIGLL